jgi:signal transduction histidine kinase
VNHAASTEPRPAVRRDNPGVTSSPRFRANQGVLLVAGSLGLAYALAATAIARRSGTTTTYAGDSGVAVWVFTSAGVALIAAGVFTWRHRPNVGVLALVAAIVWFAPIWEGWEGGPAFARTLGMLAASFVFPVLAHLVLAAAVRPLTSVAVALIASTYALIGLCAMVVILIRDPYYDPYCWANCTTNLFDVSSQPELARQITRIQLWVTAIAAATFTEACVGRVIKAFTSGPRRYWEVLPGGAVLGAVTVAHVVLLLRHPLEDPDLTGFITVFLIRCGAVVMIAAGLAATLLAARRQRRSVAEIIATLGDAPPLGTLDVALANAVGDPSLRICYWLPATGQYVDAHGHPLPDPATDPSVTTTPLVRNGEPVAVIAHHSDPADLERGLGSAARLALDNERLQAEVHARMNELIESRRRIVEAGDARRRSLERDLHDGAQQSLLAMSYDLTRARSTAERCNGALTELIDSAAVEVREAFRELRDLAHGIYPAALAAAGLGPAVTALADTSPVRVDVNCNLDQRLPASTETAAYLVVATVIEAAAHSASPISVSIDIASGDGLVIEITHDQLEAGADLVHLADRVGAVGGRIETAPDKLIAVLPCES